MIVSTSNKTALTFLGAGGHPALSVSAGASEKTVQEAQGMLEVVWAGAMQPLVMGLAGASIYFPALPSGTALRALALAAIGEDTFDLHLYLSVIMRSTATSWLEIELSIQQSCKCLLALASQAAGFCDTVLYQHACL